MKNKFELSLLLLAHTPKRNQANPITINDLAGSKHLSNFAHSVFCIGMSSKDNQLRYLKQIKARATEKIYDTNNIIVCKIEKAANFLGFAFVEYGEEYEHLRHLTENEKQALDQKIIELRRGKPHLSYREIAGALNTNHMKVKRALERNL